MPRHTKPLTALEVKLAKASDKPFELIDGKGLILKVTRQSKRWLLKYYRPSDKKRTNLSLGAYPEISLSDARILLADARDLLAKGIDPQYYRQKQAQSDQNTLKSTAKAWLDIKKHKITPAYVKDIQSSLDNHIFPKIGNIPIAGITAPQVIEIIKPVSLKGKNELVSKLCQRLNEIMVFAVNTGLIEHNRLAGIKSAFVAPVAENYPTLKPAQLPELLGAVMNASITLMTRNLILFQLHTLSRPSEAAGALWAEIDLNKKLWTIPAKRMKRKKKHIIPLTTQAVTILERMKTSNPFSDYVFAGARNIRKSANPSTVNMALKRMGFKGKLVAHGLRSLASTTLNEQSFDAEMIEVSLSHVDKNTVRSAYNRSEYIEKRRNMLNPSS